MTRRFVQINHSHQAAEIPDDTVTWAASIAKPMAANSARATSSTCLATGGMFLSFLMLQKPEMATTAVAKSTPKNVRTAKTQRFRGNVRCRTMRLIATNSGVESKAFLLF